MAQHYHSLGCSCWNALVVCNVVAADVGEGVGAEAKLGALNLDPLEALGGSHVRSVDTRALKWEGLRGRNKEHRATHRLPLASDHVAVFLLPYPVCVV